MGAVGLILFVHGETGSFGSAGIVTGAFTIGVGVTGPLLARLIDRRGTRRVILPAVLVTAAGLVAVVVLGRAGAGTVPLVVAAAIAGAGTPPVGGVLRQQWPQLVPERDLETAYALDAVSIEVNFITGPLLVGILAATAGPAVGLLVAAALGVTGVARLRPPARRPARRGPRRRAPLARRDALADPRRPRLRRAAAGRLLRRARRHPARLRRPLRLLGAGRAADRGARRRLGARRDRLGRPARHLRPAAARGGPARRR